MFDVSDIEMQRTGKSYSIDTVRDITSTLWPIHGAIFHYWTRRVSRLPYLERTTRALTDLPFRGRSQAWAIFSGAGRDVTASQHSILMG